MNNQAAQTMPSWVQERELIRAALCKELDTDIESDERTYTIAVRAANALHWRQIEIDQLKAQVAALSQTAGVAEGRTVRVIEVEKDGASRTSWSIDGYGNTPLPDGVYKIVRVERPAMIERAAMLAATPAASGGEDDWHCSFCHCASFAHIDERGEDGKFRPGNKRRCLDCKRIHDPAPQPQAGASVGAAHPDALPDGTLSKSTAKRVEALSSNPNPVTPGLSSESAASVSERARAADDIALAGCEDCATNKELRRLLDHKTGIIKRLVSEDDERFALEQALTQPLEVSGDQVVLVGYKSESGEDCSAFLTASRIGQLLALTQKRGCATCGGRGEIGGHVGQTAETFDYVTEPCPECTTPKPGAEALRELVQRWRNEFGEFHEAKLDCADELESLLARGGK